MIFLFLFSVLISKQLNVVTTIEDLASIVEEIGKQNVKVFSIAKGYQNAHFIEAKPSYMLKLNKAHLFVMVGLGLEDAWAPLLIENSRNPELKVLVASTGCHILEIPAGGITREMGDVHPFGNPHVWLDPENGVVIAKNIMEKLIELDSENSDFYKKNFAEFERKINAMVENLKEKISILKGLNAISYHNTWANFSKFTGIEIKGFIEPKPGIPPSPKHTEYLIERLKKGDIKIIFVEPYFDMRLPLYISKKTGVKVVNLYPHVGGRDDIKTYFDLFEKNIDIILEAIK